MTSADAVYSLGGFVVGMIAGLDSVVLPEEITDFAKPAELRRDLGLGLRFVTHDLGIVARVADRIVVLDHGCISKQAPIADLLAHPQHPKTRELSDGRRRWAGRGRWSPSPAESILSALSRRTWLPVRG